MNGPPERHDPEMGGERLRELMHELGIVRRWATEELIGDRDGLIHIWPYRSGLRAVCGRTPGSGFHTVPRGAWVAAPPFRCPECALQADRYPECAEPPDYDPMPRSLRPKAAEALARNGSLAGAVGEAAPALGQWAGEHPDVVLVRLLPRSSANLLARHPPDRWPEIEVWRRAYAAALADPGRALDDPGAAADRLRGLLLDALTAEGWRDEPGSGPPARA